MGLAERRATKEFETTKLPSLKQAIEGAAGCPIAIEVSWEKLAEDGMAHLYDEAWEKVYFKPLIGALAAIAIHEMGRDALKAGLKRVCITNLNGNHSGDAMASFADGVLTLDHLPTTNIDYIDERQQAIQRVIEKSL